MKSRSRKNGKKIAEYFLKYSDVEAYIKVPKETGKVITIDFPKRGNWYTAAEACKLFDKPYQTIHCRLSRNGGNLAKALFTPIIKVSRGNPTDEWKSMKRSAVKNTTMAVEKFLINKFGADHATILE